MTLLALNKPYGVLCQFTDPEGRPTLADYVHQPGVYPVGRLDMDSEGLLLLTDDGALKHRLTNPASGTRKVYLVQVEGTPRSRQLAQCRQGVVIQGRRTRPAEVELLARKPGWLWRRQPPIRVRDKVPTHWLRISLTEGRNRQVRRMTAAVGLPTLRLIREQVGDHGLDGLRPGEVREL